ncbi:hypothetical protein BGZ76_001582 [Entomortierella beljakovae]|nr:hypothetical protein BGZ76_001582 [Entomortierella beljakovae]
MDRRREAIQAQSKQIAKAIRVAKPGPQLDLSELLSNEPAHSTGLNHKPQRQLTCEVSPAKAESSSTLSIPSTSANLTSPAIHLPNQTTYNRGMQQDHRSTQLSPSSQHGFSIQQMSMKSQVDSAHPLSPDSSPMKQHSPFPVIDNINRPYIKYSQQTKGHSVSMAQLPQPYNANNPGGSRSSDGETSTVRNSPFTLTQHGFGDMGQETNKDQSHSLTFSNYQRMASNGAGNESQRGSSAGIPLQSRQSSIPNQYEINHTISSAAPVSSIAVSSQPTGISAWDHVSPLFPLYDKQHGHMGWKSEELAHQSTGYSPGLTPSTSIDLTKGNKHTSTSQKIQPEEQYEIQRMQKIARDILEYKKYDHSILLPRHISQEYDEMWITADSTTPSDLQKIPRQLLVLPKDANFLVDVFFENACFYYPILNRSVVEQHLMEPQTPQSLFLLNIIFMAACKHLARNTDIKRAIQFRERAREVQQYIDGKARLSRMQGDLLGAQVIYGVFVVVIGMAQLCGTYRPMPTLSDSIDENNEQKIDLAVESRSILANKYLMPEAVYQQRLWTFWGLYTRDAMSRLYFGWPHGFDSMDISAELPKIKGVVGLGGMRRSSTGHNGINGQQVTGKRRGGVMNKKQLQREKKLMKAGATAQTSSRDAYRISSSISDDDDDDDDGDDDNLDDGESDLEQDDFDASDVARVDIKIENDFMEKGQRSKRQTAAANPSEVNNKGFSFSGLSRHLLERQSRGEDLGRRQGSNAHTAEARR